MGGLSFGQRLRRLRETTFVAAPLGVGGWPRRGHDRRLAATVLSRLAGLDPAYVKLLEDGTRPHPSRVVVERLCTALDCSAFERALLLMSAGYWPWMDAEDEVTELLVALALAVLDGDYRPLEQHVRQAAP